MTDPPQKKARRLATDAENFGLFKPELITPPPSVNPTCPTRIWLPEDWDFRLCPRTELPVCFHYEFSRESGRLVIMVELIRRYGPKRPEYYVSRNFANFGWPQWPRQPYLIIDLEERQNRLDWFLRPPTDEALARMLDPNWSYLPSNAPRLEIQLPLDRSDKELDRSFAALRRKLRRCHWDQSRKPRATGRAATKAHYSDWLRVLGVHRLRRQYTAARTLEILQAAYGKDSTYQDESSVERARQKADRHIKVFCQQAERIAHLDVWFVPFTNFSLEI